jgi:small subunit ribosomal protein S7
LQQGTPVEEVVKGDTKAQEKLPKVMRDAIKASKPSNSRSFSTSANRQQDGALSDSSSGSAPLDPTIVESGTSIITDPHITELSNPGVKFGLPSIPIPSDHNLHHRYDPIIDQFTGLLIQHGKKGVAQRVPHIF